MEPLASAFEGNEALSLLGDAHNPGSLTSVLVGSLAADDGKIRCTACPFEGGGSVAADMSTINDALCGPTMCAPCSKNALVDDACRASEGGSGCKLRTMAPENLNSAATIDMVFIPDCAVKSTEESDCFGSVCKIETAKSVHADLELSVL